MLLYSTRIHVPGHRPHDLPKGYTVEPDTLVVVVDNNKPTHAQARKESRRIKLHAPPPVPEGTILFWLDASLRPRPGLLEAARSWLTDHDVAMFRHPFRDCAYEETDECVRRKKIDPRLGAEIKSTLALNSLPKHWGLWASGAIAWRNDCRRLRESWWHWTQTTGYRDQIALPLALRESGYRDRLFTVDGNIYDFFEWTPHGHTEVRPAPKG
jgi:hypothetical protein